MLLVYSYVKGAVMPVLGFIMSVTMDPAATQANQVKIQNLVNINAELANNTATAAEVAAIQAKVVVVVTAQITDIITTALITNNFALLDNIVIITQLMLLI